MSEQEKQTIETQDEHSGGSPEANEIKQSYVRPELTKLGLLHAATQWYF